MVARNAQFPELFFHRVRVNGFFESGAFRVFLRSAVFIDEIRRKEIIDHEFFDRFAERKIVPREFGEFVNVRKIESLHVSDLADRFGEIVNGRDECFLKLLGRVYISGSSILQRLDG